MALSQIAFDFDSLPEQPVTKPEQPTIPAKRIQRPIDLTKPVKPKSTRGRMSLKNSEASANLIDIPPDDILFERAYYPIRLVAEMFRVNQSLIRLWENEFDILKPKKNGKGDRLFRPEDIKNIQLIHHLLRERKYTMEGAKTFIKSNKKLSEKADAIDALKKVKAFLLELKSNL